MSKTIVLFGGYGMLGTALRQTLHTYPLLIPRHSEVDITQRAAVLEYIQAHSPAVVINAAAYTKVDDCETNQTVAQQVNGEAPGFMAEAAQQCGARLFHYSTDYVFSGTKQSGYVEVDQPDQPVNAYGASKLLGEQLIQQHLPDRHYIMRTAWLFGAGGQNFVDTMLRLGRTKPALQVVNDQHGSPTYTEDLAKVTRALMEGVLPGGIYHVTNSGVCTWYEFAQEIFRLAQLPVSVTPCTSAEVPRPARRPTYSMLINTKTPPLRSWQTALADYITSSSGQR